MEREWTKIQAHVRDGTLSRRDFLASAAALGISSTLVDRALAEVPQRGGHLKMGVSAASSADTLDPGLFKAHYMNTVGPQLYDCLTRVDEKVKVQPALAVSWEGKPGAKEWVVKLRKDVTFHNGKTMTPADVVYSINHHLGKESKSAARGLMSSVSQVKPTAPDEVTFYLDSGNADMPYVLADWHLTIVPEGSPFTSGVGTGAFQIESFEPGVRAVTKRRKDDWNNERGYLDSIETLAINDRAARLSALLSGSVHVINEVDFNAVPAVKRNPNLQTFDISGSAHNSFPCRVDTAPFDKLDMRLALKYSIDRETILKTILRGFGKIGNDHSTPNFDPMFASDIPQRPYDPDRAKFHYRKAGHEGPLVLTVAETAFPGCVDMAQLWRASAAKAGIDIQVNRVPNDGYYDKVWLINPFCATLRGGRPTIDLMMSLAYLGSSPWNDSHWKNAKFDQLLFAARAELDFEKRKAMYHDMQWLIYNEGGANIPVFMSYIDGGSSKVKGFVPHPIYSMGGWRASEKIWLAA
jgi:peptide/nickel transport system substrate-binding protein